MAPKGTKKPEVGFICSGSREAYKEPLAAFRQGLKLAGWKPNDLKIHLHFADGHYGRLRQFADDLVRRDVNVIAVTGGATAARAVLPATKDIPIVFAGAFLEIAGLVKDREKPEGNATGVDVYTTEYYKLESLKERLELMNDLVPGATVAILVNQKSFAADIEKKQASEISGQKPIILEASNVKELGAAFASAREKGVGALLVSPDAFFTSQRKKIVALAKRHKLPASYPWSEYVDVGGLMSYGPELTNSWRRVGLYAGVALKGKKPVEMPVLQPEYAEFVLNLKTAKKLRLEVPLKVLAEADEIRE
jgi:putative ABC transport system substrate-binding protein